MLFRKLTWTPHLSALPGKPVLLSGLKYLPQQQLRHIRRRRRSERRSMEEPDRLQERQQPEQQVDVACPGVSRTIVVPAAEASKCVAYG